MNGLRDRAEESLLPTSQLTGGENSPHVTNPHSPHITEGPTQNGVSEVAATNWYNVAMNNNIEQHTSEDDMVKSELWAEARYGANKT